MLRSIVLFGALGFGALVFLASCSSHKTAKIANPPAAPLTARAGDREDDQERRPEAYADSRAPSRRPDAIGEMEKGDPDGDEGPEADSPDLAATFFRMQRWQQPGDFPMERYLQAKSDAHRLPSISLAARSGETARLSPEAGPTFGTWQALGPGNVGGRVRGIAIDPNNSNTIYSAAASGGVWKTTNGGQTWNPISDFLPVLGIGSMAMDPTNSAILYVGTGEAQHNAIALRGVGIYKTTDGGQTWNPLTFTANNSNFYYVNALAINPTQPLHIYAGTTTGLFFSPDGGVHWTPQVLKTGTTYNCTSLAIRSDQPTDYVFAACGATVTAC